MSRRIPDLDLARFPPPQIEGNRSRWRQLAWYLVQAAFFQTSLPLLSYRAKARILRAFGASVGEGLVIKPRVTIKYPWFLTLGDHVWVGEKVWIDNPGPVTVGSNVCISQGAYLVTGNHDFRTPEFAFFQSPIEIGDHVWIAARCVVPPGSRVPANTMIPVGTVWRNPRAE